MWRLSSYFRKGAEVVSTGARFFGAPHSFCFRVSVGFNCVRVNSILLLLDMWCFGVRVGGREPLWALGRGGIGG